MTLRLSPESEKSRLARGGLAQVPRFARDRKAFCEWKKWTRAVGSAIGNLRSSYGGVGAIA